MRTPAADGSTELWQAPYPGGWARNFRFGEWLGDPITPLFETWLLRVLERAFWAALRRVADMASPHPTYVVVNGWYFTSMNLWPQHGLGWFLRLVCHPRLIRVLLQFVPSLADWALRPWVREWSRQGLPQYRAPVQQTETQVAGLDPPEFLQLVDRVGVAAGEYFVWIALVAGAGYKTEAPLARFYRQHLFPIPQTVRKLAEALQLADDDRAILLAARARPTHQADTDRATEPLGLLGQRPIPLPLSGGFRKFEALCRDVRPVGGPST
jgi:hypothetical protein